MAKKGGRWGDKGTKGDYISTYLPLMSFSIVGNVLCSCCIGWSPSLMSPLSETLSEVDRVFSLGCSKVVFGVYMRIDEMNLPKVALVNYFCV